MRFCDLRDGIVNLEAVFDVARLRTRRPWPQKSPWKILVTYTPTERGDFDNCIELEYRSEHERDAMYSKLVGVLSSHVVGALGSND